MLRQLNRVPVQTSSWTSIFSARTGTIRNSRPTCSTVQRLVTAHREQRRLGTLFAMKRDHIVMQATTADTDNKQVKVDMPPPGSALQEYVLRSPIAVISGLEEDEYDLDRWHKLGEIMSKRLKQPSFEDATEQQRARVYQYHLPIYLWLHRQLLKHRKAHPDTAFCVGMSAPQGSGKTTICEELQHLLSEEGFHGVFASLDDFYLPFDGQQALAKANASNRLLGVRGNAGSHDTKLAHETFQALKAAKADTAEVGVVRYDKSQHEGRGDRAAESKWQMVKGPVDVVLFEGWMLGFRPLSDADAEKAGEDIAAVNHHLKGYKSAIDDFIDIWFVVKVADPTFVYKWRLQAEQASKKAGKSGMTDDQVKDFVDRYMPGYINYLPGLYTAGPTTAQPGKVLTIEIDADRQLVAAQPEQH